jgi:hypothetical protein
LRRLFRPLSLVALLGLAIGLVPPAAAAETWSNATFIHYADGAPIPTGGGFSGTGEPSNPTPTPDRDDRKGDRDDRKDDRDRDRARGESPNFNLQPGAVRWLRGPRVEYRIVNAPFKRAEHAVEQAEKTLDKYITTRTFKHDDDTRQRNPCSGLPNTISWAPIDGPVGIVARSRICFNPATREIGGFDIQFDSLDGWSIGPDGDPRTYDVENVATHEFGHVAGLDHVTGPQDRCLTMYVATSPEEIEQRTLGWGDKRGLDVLYDTDDTDPGPGCGR